MKARWPKLWLAKTSLQEVSIAVWAWKCQNWPMKVSKGQNTFAKTSNLNVQPPQKNYGGSFVRGPVRYSPDVPLKLNMDMAKVFGKRTYLFIRRRCPFPSERI